MIKFSLTKNIRKSYQPKYQEISLWIKKSLITSYNYVNIDIIIVSAEKSQELNLHFRNKDYPTNVIAIEYQNANKQLNLLYGELFLCDAVIVSEASKQQKNILTHYAHMIIHGMLHIQGLDHQNLHDRNIMEYLEIKILQELNFANPYVIA